MCSDTECLEMLIVLIICFFFMSNDSGDMSFGDFNRTISPERCIVT